MPDFVNELSRVSSDLKALIQDERDQGRCLFSTPVFSSRFPSPAITPPPRPKATAAKPKPKPPAPVKPAPQTQPAQAAQVQKPKPLPTPQAAPPPQAGFELEKLPQAETSPIGHGGIAERIKKLFPAWKLKEHPLSDEEAVKIACIWKVRATATEILVLSFSSDPFARSFMHNFAAALSQSIAPAQLIDGCAAEKDNLWEAVFNAPNLKEIYAPPMETWNAPHLLKHVKSIPATKEHFLGNCRLRFLQEAVAYKNSPQLKRILWQEICARK